MQRETFFFRNLGQEPNVIGRPNPEDVESHTAFFNTELQDLVQQELYLLQQDQSFANLAPLEASSCFRESCRRFSCVESTDFF